MSSNNLGSSARPEQYGGDQKPQIKEEQQEQQNDSPAFRLRPRRAAPKSYYTVRLEYSANPSAFIRERPRTKQNRKVFTSKTGSQRYSNSGLASGAAAAVMKLATVITREEKELEAKRLCLEREISESITATRMISPFIQRLTLDELKPDTIYEHNYVTLRIKKIGRSTNGQLAHCLCESIDHEEDTDIDDNEIESPPRQTGFTNVAVRLYNEYAQTSLLKPEKLISIAKFKTTIALPWQESHHDALDDQSQTSTTTANSTTSVMDNSSSSVANIKDNTKRLPFMIIVKYDEFASTTTTPTSSPHKNSTLDNQQSSGGNGGASSSRLGGGGGKVCDVGGNNSIDTAAIKTNMPVGSETNSKNKRRPLIPFISITDMIEPVEEPFVEMGK